MKILLAEANRDVRAGLEEACKEDPLLPARISSADASVLEHAGQVVEALSAGAGIAATPILLEAHPIINPEPSYKP